MCLDQCLKNTYAAYANVPECQNSSHLRVVRTNILGVTSRQAGTYLSSSTYLFENVWSF